MYILSWNVNGIRAVQKKGFLDFFDEYAPDILCLQETKAHPEQLDSVLLEREGYHVFFSSAEKKGYSGVCMYSKRKPVAVNYGFNDERFNNEGRIIEADFEDFILYNIYFPNGTSGEERLQYKMDFYEHFLTELEARKSRKIIICGDVNTAHQEIDLKNPKANARNSGFLPMEREWIDKLLSRGFVDTFRHFYPDTVKYSWWTYRMGARKRNVGWRLDYHFVNETMLAHCKDSTILNEVMGSDHCPVGLKLGF